MDLWKEWNEREPIGGSTRAENLFKGEKRVVRCEYCLDKGYRIVKGKAVKCDKCSGIIKKEELKERSKEEIVSEMDRLQIPVYYRGKEFTPEILKTDEILSLDIRRDPLMDYYIDRLKLVYDYFVLGKKLDNSYIVMAPQGYAKAHFVYCSMQEAIKHGFSVAPYYDTSDIYRMYYQDDKRLIELIDSDVCFIKIIPAFVTKRDTQAVKYILDKRARRSLPTIVISRFNMKYLGDIEPHLVNNFGLKNVEKGDYSKLKEILGPYPRNYEEKYVDMNVTNNVGGNIYGSGKRA